MNASEVGTVESRKESLGLERISGLFSFFGFRFDFGEGMNIGVKR